MFKMYTLIVYLFQVILAFYVNIFLFSGVLGERFLCLKCNRIYRSKYTLNRHHKYECGKEPSFKCLYCSKACFQKTHLLRHMFNKHGIFNEN